jgi:hypothetical protein
VTQEGGASKKKSFANLRKVCDAYLEDRSYGMMQAYRKGDKRQLPAAVALCHFLGVPRPPWVEDALVEAFISSPKCWEDVFGRSHGLGAEEEELRRVWSEVSALREKGVMTTDVFDNVAEKLNMSAGTARRRYYDKKPSVDTAQAVLDGLGLRLEEIEEWPGVLYFGLLLHYLHPEVWELLKTMVKENMARSV